MKRYLALFTVIALGVALLAFAGCGGGDTEQAREILRKAEESYAALSKELTSLQGTLTSAIGGAMSGNYSLVTPEALQQADQAVSRALEQIPKVKAEYDKVNDLNGVEDYQAYADAMRKALEAQEGAVKAGKQLLDSLTPVVASGDAAQIQQWFQANNAALMQAQSASAEVEKANSEAQRIKSDKNLEF